MKNELRYTNTELRASKSKMEISGLAVVYGRKSAPISGAFREKAVYGCLTRCLAGNPDVRMLAQHNPSLILGRTKNGTLVLNDTPDGLQFTCQLNERSSYARDTYEAIKRGDLDACSFGFVVPDGGDQFVDDPEDRSMPLRILRRIDLFDTSVVTFPAYPEGTSVQARSLHRDVRSIGVYSARGRSWSELQAECRRLGRVIAGGEKSEAWWATELARLQRNNRGR